MLVTLRYNTNNGKELSIFMVELIRKEYCHHKFEV
jgi:hypothetical protein